MSLADKLAVLDQLMMDQYLRHSRVRLQAGECVDVQLQRDESALALRATPTSRRVSQHPGCHDQSSNSLGLQHSLHGTA